MFQDDWYASCHVQINKKAPNSAIMGFGAKMILSLQLLSVLQHVLGTIHRQ